MPFDPNAYLAKKQTQVAKVTGSDSPAAFDPDAYLASKNVPTEQAPAAQPGLAAQAVAAAGSPMTEAYGQGAALGYGSQLNAGIQAAAGVVDQAVNSENNFGDQSKPDAGFLTRTLDAISNFPKNYTRAKKGVDADLNKARADDAVKAGLLELAGSIAPSFLGAKGLGAAGMVSTPAQAATTAGIYGYGSSQKEGADRVGDAAFSSLLGYGIGKGVQAGGALLSSLKGPAAAATVAEPTVADAAANLYSDYHNPISSIAEAAAADTPQGMSFKPKFGETFTISKEMKAALTDPDVRGGISKELNAQPEIVQNIIQSTKQKLGDLWKPMLAQHGDVVTQADPILNKAYEAASNVAVEGDDVAQKLQQALFGKIKSFAQTSQLNDPVTNTGGNLSLKQLTEAQEALGNAIWRDKQFAKAPGVEASAKRIWGQLADAGSKLDETKGSGGQLGIINKVFKAMFGMEDNMVNGATMKSLVNPDAVGADNKWSQFVKPFEQLPANVKAQLAPEMHDYLANQFPKLFSKVKAMVAANGGSEGGIVKNILSLSGLKAASTALTHSTATQLGRAAGVAQPIAAEVGRSMIPSIERGAEIAGPGMASSIGSQATTQQQQ